MVKKIVVRIGTAFLGILAAMILVELTLRLIQYHYYPMHIQTLADTTLGSPSAPKDDWRYFSVFADSAFVYDPMLIWKPNVSYTIQSNGKTVKFFNSSGFPGPLVSEERFKRTHRIAAIGDSNTLGLREYDPSTGREVGWPAYLNASLGNTFTVINAGVWGYSSLQTMNRFYTILHFDPQLVIMSPSGNDGHLVTVSDAQYSYFQLQKITILLHVRLAQLLQQFIDRYVYLRKSATDYPLVQRVSLTEYRKILLNLIAQAHKRGITLVLMSRPYLETKNITYNVTPYNELTKQIARDHSIPFIDSQLHFATASSLYLDPVRDTTHLNESGLKQMGLFIKNELVRLRLL